jgi:hypothetical protein
VFSYLGLETSTAVRTAALLAPLLLVAAALWLAARGVAGREPLALAALAALLGVVVLPGLALESTALPLALVAAAATRGFSECA